MELIFSGIGAAYYPVFDSNSAFFVHGDHLYLIDCGESTFKKMFARNEIYSYDKITVLITHLHADHIGSLGSFLSFCKSVLHKKVQVVAEESTIVNILTQEGIGADSYDFSDDFSCCAQNDLKIVPVPARHVDNMKCCGFLLQQKHETTFYSGDTSIIPERILQEFLEGHIQKIYQDCTFLTGQSRSHCSLEQLQQWIPEGERHRVICMHLGCDMREDIKTAGFQIAAQV